MKHRMSTGTGLGSGEKAIMNNKWTENTKLNDVIKEMLDEAIYLWFKDANAVDFNIEYAPMTDWVEVTLGIEPTYQYDHLKIFVISTNSTMSRWEQGVAWGAYGSGIVKNTKAAYEYKYNSKFKRFVDKWARKLKEVVTLGAVY